MRDFAWRVIAKIVSWRPVAAWIIKRAKKTPYWHLEGYMERWWLFNPQSENEETNLKRWPNLPSIRIHHILRADDDRHLHNHPWHARTIILSGWYVESRMIGRGVQDRQPICLSEVRRRGDTAAIKPNDFHKIALVPPGGVWTLFLTWRKEQRWGFLTEAGFVDSKRYFLQMRRIAEKDKNHA